MLYKIIVVLLKILVHIIFNLKIYNSDKINNIEGRIIVCSNHISIIDPVILAISLRRQVHFMGKKELFENRLLSYIFKKLGAFPVDREGVSFSAIKNSLNVLKNDGILGIYPEGTRVSEGYNESNAKPGIAMIANKSKSKIIPVYIKGPYKFRGKIELYFGNPKDYFNNTTEKVNSEKYAEIGKEILKDIYKLEKTGKTNVY
ncbi:lysophospholipid acyltransferase family protein [Sedimentibacter sp. MB31-C6]|uniref:lysophospholipid acyltransferase family protein n=1 Tax=Sedimentibacter sp. MB31-C6 TaxID=3109366 RepID=UPI002DDCBE65|nr:lysophospholipid acyltransferase family protein [Sedimentibacter sp. MB36-C1]WSI04212.1 lysophospholipid acyltransferase family protein [Sedimentibacter sp. MB36-C1]